MLTQNHDLGLEFYGNNSNIQFDGNNDIFISENMPISKGGIILLKKL